MQARVIPSPLSGGCQPELPHPRPSEADCDPVSLRTGSPRGKIAPCNWVQNLVPLGDAYHPERIMSGQIDVWFTMASTYTYLSVTRLPAVEKDSGITFRWRPFSLITILREMKHVPFAPAVMTWQACRA